MKSIIVSILLSCFILSGYAQGKESAETASGKTTNGFLVHIKSGESQFKVMKGVNFAKNMADKGHDVLVYFDTDATYLTLAETEDFEFNGKSFKTQLDNLLTSNADVRVCKGNLTQVLKKTPDEVVAGIELGDPNMFFTFTDGRIVTMDYQNAIGMSKLYDACHALENDTTSSYWLRGVLAGFLFFYDLVFLALPLNFLYLTTLFKVKIR